MNIPSIVNGGAGVVLICSRYSRKDYITQTLTSTERSIRVNQVTRRNDWQSLCGLLIYSYMSVSDDPEHRFSEDVALEDPFQDVIEPPATPQARRGACPRRSLSQGCRRRSSERRDRGRPPARERSTSRETQTE